MTTQTRARPATPAETRISLEEFFGLAVVSLGLLCLLNLLVAKGLPLVTVLMGWTGPFVGLACVAAGVLALLGHRSPRWKLESALGAVLLQVALMAGSYIWNQTAVSWTPVLDGSLGGLFGQGLGNMLLSVFGSTGAGLMIHATVIVSFWLLVRFSPLILIPVVVNSLLLHSIHRMRGVAPETASPSVKSSESTPSRPEADRPPRTGSQSKETAPGSTEEKKRTAPAQRPMSAAARDRADSGRAEAAATSAVGQGNGRQSAAPNGERNGAARGSRVRPVSRLTGAGSYRALPSLDLLSNHEGHGVLVAAHETSRRLQEAYADFNLPVKVVNVEAGPSLTRFGLEPGRVLKGDKEVPVRVKEILARKDDVALALEVEALHYRAPVPGRPYVGVDVPNSDRETVGLKEALKDSWDFISRKGALNVALGREAGGEAVTADLLSAPHLLVGGATGTGKSTFISALLASLLMQHGPDTLNLILVDPKGSDMTPFDGLPHLVGRRVKDRGLVSTLLLWLMLQMEKRFELFRDQNVRNILGYNQQARLSRNVDVLPYIVLVIDELAEVLTRDRAIEKRLCRLAQKCRATGIHIVLATQRPSAGVVTGTIKANFPARVAFRVSSLTDSRVILDEGGAENLLGQGDLLFRMQGRGQLKRIQGSLADEDDVRAIVRHWKNVHAGLQPAEQVEPWRGLLKKAA